MGDKICISALKSSLTAYNKNTSAEMYDKVFEELFDIGFSTNFTTDKRIKIGMLTFHAFTTFKTLELQYNAAIKWGLSPKRLRGKVIPFKGTRLREIYEAEDLMAGTQFKPAFKFIDSSISDFYNLWYPFIDELSHLRDSLREIQKEIYQSNILLFNVLTKNIEYLDRIGLDVFYNLIGIIKTSNLEEAKKYILTSKNEYEIYWNHHIKNKDLLIGLDIYKQELNS